MQEQSVLVSIGLKIQLTGENLHNEHACNTETSNLWTRVTLLFIFMELCTQNIPGIQGASIFLLLCPCAKAERSIQGYRS